MSYSGSRYKARDVVFINRLREVLGLDPLSSEPDESANVVKSWDAWPEDDGNGQTIRHSTGPR